MEASAIQSASAALIDAVIRAGIANEARFAVVSRDTLTDATAQLPFSEEVLTWYAIAAPLDAEIPFYPEDLTLFDPHEILTWQEGYRWFTGKRDVIEPGWDPRWLVIGNYIGDPIIALTDQPETPIAMAEHGRGLWTPYLVAPSLAAYLRTLAVWIEVSTIDFSGDIRDDENWTRPEFRAALDARLTPILTDEYRRHWLNLEELKYQ